LLLRPWGSGGGGPAATDTQAAGPPASPVSSPQPSEPAPAGQDLPKLRESFERKDYAETVRLAELILSQDPAQGEAKDLRGKAKAELDAVRAASLLETGIARYESGDYAACVRDMEDILRLDGDNPGARDYLFKADTVLSKRDILAMIERRRQGEEAGDLEAVLKGLGSEDLISQERVYYSTIFTIYDGIKSKIQEGTISVDFADRTHATAGFHHAIQGVSRKDGKQKPVLYSQERWILEKRGGVWKIVGIQERS
jgi:hypothetical protein